MSGPRQLALGLRAREPWALEQVYRQYESMVSRRVRRLVRDPAMSEDLVQEVFYRVWRSAETLDEDCDSIAGWLATVARNIAIDYLRSDGHRKFGSDVKAVPADIAGNLSDRETLELGAAVHSLRPDYRTLIELSFEEGLSHLEIAQRFRCPLGSVKTWIREALVELRRVLAISGLDKPGDIIAGTANGLGTRRIGATRAAVLLHTVIEHAPEAVVLADQRARFVLWNRAAEQLFGANAMSMTGKSCSEGFGLFLPDGTSPHPETELPLWRAIRGESVEDATLLLRNATYPSGLILLCTAKPRLDTGERLSGGILTCRRAIAPAKERSHILPRKGAARANEQLPAKGYEMSIKESGIAPICRLEDVFVPELPPASPGRVPDLGRENAGLQELARQMATDPDRMLQRLVELAVDICQAGSAGISLLEKAPDGQEIFRWAVLAGKFESYVGGTTPRSWSPCGVTLDRCETTLFRYPGRFFTYFQEAQPEIVEGLVIPFKTDQDDLGTIWIVSHDEERRFDAEDGRIMRSLGDFTAAAATLNAARLRAEEGQARLHTSEEKLRHSRMQLHAANRKISTILDSIADALISVDHDWRITYLNAEAARTKRKRPEDLLGKSFWAEWPGFRGDPVEDRFRQAAADGVAVHLEHYEARRSMWQELNGWPSTEGMSLSVRDIGDRKRTDES